MKEAPAPRDQSTVANAFYENVGDSWSRTTFDCSKKIMADLKRFWFSFEKLPSPSVVNIGCGVTAFDRTDAELLLRASVFKGRTFPTIIGCIENIDVSKLDPLHVLPNMGQVTVRGVWFPQFSAGTWRYRYE